MQGQSKAQLALKVLKRGWKVGTKYATAALAGYEAHEIVDGMNGNQVVATPQQVFHSISVPDEDQFGANEIIIILLAVIVVLLLLILSIFAGIKFIKFIGKRAVKRYQNEDE